MSPWEKFKVGETLRFDIGPKLNRMVDKINSLIPHGDHATIKVNRTPGGCYFSTLIRGGGGAGGGGSSTQYIAKISQKPVSSLFE